MAEMRTELIIETSNALNNIKILKDTLEAIDQIKFQQLSNAMNSIGKSLNDVKKSAKDATDAQKNQSKTLMGELKQQRLCRNYTLKTPISSRTTQTNGTSQNSGCLFHLQSSLFYAIIPPTEQN